MMVENDFTPIFHERGADNNCYLQSQALCQVLPIPCLCFSNPPNSYARSCLRAFALLSPLAGNVLPPDDHRAKPPSPSGLGLCHLFREAFPDCPTQKNSLLHHSLPLLPFFVTQYVYIHCPFLSSRVQAPRGKDFCLIYSLQLPQHLEECLTQDRTL